MEFLIGATTRKQPLLSFLGLGGDNSTCSGEWTVEFENVLVSARPLSGNLGGIGDTL